MLLDAKKLWIEGGYGLNNNFEVSIRRIKKYGKDKGLKSGNVDLILIDLFLALRDNPTLYRTDDNICFCGCTIRNSGTNLIHRMFQKIDAKSADIIEIENKLLTDELNAKIITYIEKDNKSYTDKFGPNRDPYWYEMPTFKRWLRIR